MPAMQNFQELDVLFFEAWKYYAANINQHLVQGKPNRISNVESYKTFQKDFVFRSYKEAVVAGLYWTRKLFGNLLMSNVHVKHFEFGRKKQWFNVQLVQTSKEILIDGERYFPFVNVEYAYNAVTKIKLEIGFYRYACSNGLVTGCKELMKLDINTEKLFDVPFWVNPCMLKFLQDRLDVQVKVLKRTQVRFRDMEDWLRMNVKWNVNVERMRMEIEEHGANAYALLNILTYSASNFDEGENLYHSDKAASFEEDRSSNSARAVRQRRAGVFLEALYEQILQENQLEVDMVDINSPHFLLNDEFFNRLQPIRLQESYKLNIGKVRF